MAYGRRGYGGLGGAQFQGDPFLGGLLKGVGKVFGGVAKAGVSLLPGPVGTIARGALNVLPTGRPSSIPAPPAARLQGISPTFTPGLPGVPITGGCPKGHHVNKSSYFLKNGTHVPAGTRCVPNRHMNPANSRALRRGMRREESFIRLARRTGLVTVPKAKRVRRAASRGRRR